MKHLSNTNNDDKCDFYTQLGSKIRKVREQKGYSRECLAKLCDISTKHIYEIECNGKGFSVIVFYKIANALEVSCDELLELSFSSVKSDIDTLRYAKLYKLFQEFKSVI